MIRGWRELFAVACAVAGLAWTSQAFAIEMPIADYYSGGPLNTPSAAWTSYGAAATHSSTVAAWTQTPPEIVAQARALGGGGRLSQAQFIANVLAYVQNNVAIEFRFGLSKGARGALIDQSGTAFDQADLMVQILRQGGVAADYQIGTISLTAQQFGLWSGLVQNLNPAAQTFTVNAQAACSFLTDGVIPATLTDASAHTTTTSCSVLTGTLATSGTAVVMGHAWVVIGGNYYDPSFKQHQLFAPVDLASAMGCGNVSAPTCGSNTVSAALTGASSSTVAGLPSLQNLNNGAIAGQLQAEAASLQSYVQANNRIGQLREIVGGKAILPTIALPSGDYTAWNSFSGAVGIPDQFRSVVNIGMAGIGLPMYADEVAGKRLRLFSYGTAATPTFALYADDKLLASAACSSCGQTTAPTPTGATVFITHPYLGYSADGINYILENFTAPVTILPQFGDTSASTEQFYADLQQSDPSPFKGGGSTFCTGTNAQDLCREEAQPTLAAHLLVQQDQADRILGAIASAPITHHHRVVFVIDRTYGGTPAMVMKSISSIESGSNDLASRGAASGAASAILSALQGSALRQVGDLTASNSGVADLKAANGAGYRFIQVNSGAAMSTLQSSGLLSNYSSARLSFLQGLANAGLTFIMPQNGQLPSTTDGAVLGAWGPSYGMYDINESDSGASAANVADWAASALRVSSAPSTGGLGLTPGPDIVTGTGGFPRSLPFQRSYASDFKAQETEEQVVYYGPGSPSAAPRGYFAGPEADAFSRLGSGWSHNYDITARVMNDALKAMGRDSALDASAFVASVYTLYDTKRTAALANDMTGALEANWLEGALIHNAVAINVAGASSEYGLLPDGSYNPPQGSADKVTVSGGLGQVTVTDSLGRTAPVYDYSALAISYTDKSGAVISFTPSDHLHNYSGGNPALPVFAARTWTFPDGMKLVFSYGTWTNPTNVYDYLTSVANSLGRSLTFNLVPSGGTANFFRIAITQVSDENGRSVNFSHANCPNQYSNNGGGTAATATFNCNTFTVTQPDTRVYKYTYDPNTDSPDPSLTPRPTYHLRRWYKPSDQVNALEVVAYDELARLKTKTDVIGRVAASYASGVFPGELSKRVESVDPLGYSSISQFDQWGDLVSSADPLGRTSTYAYDSAHRLTLATAPEGNSTAYAYDVRSNVLTTTAHAKPGSGLADITGSVTYGEGPTVFACANIVICNKPATSTDGRGTVTSFSWNSTTGLQTQVLGGDDGSGKHPETDYSYTAYTSTGAAASTFYILTGASQKVSTTQTLVTSYAPNTTNKYVPLSTTVDPSGIAATTTYTYDGIGNLTALDGPLPNTSDVTDVWQYSWDANRRPVFSTKPDPDGTGSLRAPATEDLYDADGNLYVIYQGAVNDISGAGLTVMLRTVYTYDAVGRTIESSAVDGTPSTVATTGYSYDADDRPICTAVRMNPAVYGSLPSDACAYSTSIPDNLDRITRNTYDAAGQLLTETWGYGSANQITHATYSYSNNGKRQTLLDARSNLSTYGYDGFDRLVKLQFPAPSTANTSSTTDYEAYTYDADGNLITKQLRNSPTPSSAPVITHCYDALNRERRTYLHTAACTDAGVGSDVFTDYDLLGRPCRIRFGNSGGDCSPGVEDAVKYGYDTAGRLVTESTGVRTMTYGYDVAGDRTSIAWPDGTFMQYLYQAGGLLTEMRVQGLADAPIEVPIDYSYDQLLNLQAVGRARGTLPSTNYSYDAVNRLVTLTHSFPNPASNITFGMAFNPASQLTTYSVSNPAFVWTNRPAGVVNKTYDGDNRDAGIVAIAGYDARGNLVSEGSGGRGFNYDVLNRLTFVGGYNSLALTYDPAGRLASTTFSGTATNYLYMGDQLVAEYDGSGNMLRRYVPGASPDQPEQWYEGSGWGTPRWLERDNHGSVVAWSDVNGTLGEAYSYGPYGEPQTWTGSRYRYTGQIMLPEAQLYFYKARVYDPIAGRFLQNDPIGYAGGLNLYAYAGQDPVNGNDPSGELNPPTPVQEPPTPVQQVVINGQRSGGGSLGDVGGSAPTVSVIAATYTGDVTLAMAYYEQLAKDALKKAKKAIDDAKKKIQQDQQLQNKDGKPAYCSSLIYQAGAAIQGAGTATQDVGSAGVLAGGAIAAATWFTGFGDGAGAAVAGGGAAIYARGTAMSELGNGIAWLGGQSPGVTAANMISIPLKGGLLGPIVADKLIDHAKEQAGLKSPC